MRETIEQLIIIPHYLNMKDRVDMVLNNHAFDLSCRITVHTDHLDKDMAKIALSGPLLTTRAIHGKSSPHSVYRGMLNSSAIFCADIKGILSIHCFLSCSNRSSIS